LREGRDNLECTTDNLEGGVVGQISNAIAGASGFKVELVYFYTMLVNTNMHGKGDINVKRALSIFRECGQYSKFSTSLNPNVVEEVAGD
jgi:hypothetical protein